jgi:hypothetical protein
VAAATEAGSGVALVGVMGVVLEAGSEVGLEARVGPFGKHSGD